MVGGGYDLESRIMVGLAESSETRSDWRLAAKLLGSTLSISSSMHAPRSVLTEFGLLSSTRRTRFWEAFSGLAVGKGDMADSFERSRMSSLLTIHVAILEILHANPLWIWLRMACCEMHHMVRLIRSLTTGSFRTIYSWRSASFNKSLG